MSDRERPSARSPERPPARPSDDAAEAERSGPLISERHRKADGRLLILYRTAGDISPPRPSRRRHMITGEDL